MDGIGFCVCGNPDCYVSVIGPCKEGMEVIGDICGIKDVIVSSTFLNSASSRFAAELEEMDCAVEDII